MMKVIKKEIKNESDEGDGYDDNAENDEKR